MIKQNYMSIFVLLLFLSACQYEELQKIKCEASDDVVYSVAEQQPAFVECISSQCANNGLRKFIFENLIYPHAAKVSKVTGTVYVSFIVEKSGCLNEKKILKGLGYGCDEEALRIVNIMPAWIPGKVNGLPQRVRFVMPITFVL